MLPVTIDLGLQLSNLAKLYKHIKTFDSSCYLFLTVLNVFLGKFPIQTLAKCLDPACRYIPRCEGILYCMERHRIALHMYLVNVVRK